MLFVQCKPGQSFSLPPKVMKDGEAKSASSRGDTSVRDYVCRSRYSVSLIFVYHPESRPGAPSLPSTNPPALLTHRETSPSPNQCAVFCVCVSVLKFGWECFVQWDASTDLSDGRELQPLLPRSKVLLMMKERKRARETNFQRLGPVSKERRKFWDPKKRHWLSERIKQSVL